MKTKNLLIIGVVLVVLYVVYKKVNNKLTITEEDKSSAIGTSRNTIGDPEALGLTPCFCNGTFLGYTNKRNCKGMCRRKVRTHGDMRSIN